MVPSVLLSAGATKRHMDDAPHFVGPSDGRSMGISPTLIFAADDAERRLDLRNKRRLAAGLLIGMAASFLTTFLVASPGFWTMLARHSIEAGLAGGLADWFAVTALFRRPLGLPIPYTGIVEDQKERLGRGVGNFVERNFLSPTLIVARIRAIDPAGHVATWLTTQDNARRLVRRLSALPSGTESDDLRRFVVRMMGDELGKLDFAPLLGRTLRVLSNSQAADVLFDRLLDGFLDLVFDNAERIHLAVERQGAWWMPRAFDRRFTNAMLKGLDEFIEELRLPNSDSRAGMRASIEQIATGLVESEQYREQVDTLKRRLIADPDIQAWLNSIWHQIRDALLADGGTTKTGAVSESGIVSFLENCGRALHTDPELRRHVDELVTSMAQNAIVLLRGEIGTYIADVVKAWDARTIADRMELTIGANLQFVRINGTIVGALAGCGLFLLSWLLG